MRSGTAIVPNPVYISHISYRVGSIAVQCPYKPGVYR
jgi:hypothetical protein